MSFFLSGVMHIAADAGGGVTFTESGALRTFCTQALGVVIEDAVQYVYRTHLKRSGQNEITMFERCVGYIWVLSFLIWSSPAWVFPVTRNMRFEDDLLSWNAVKPILFGR